MLIFFLGRCFFPYTSLCARVCVNKSRSTLNINIYMYIHIHMYEKKRKTRNLENEHTSASEHCHRQRHIVCWEINSLHIDNWMNDVRSNEIWEIFNCKSRWNILYIISRLTIIDTIYYSSGKRNYFKSLTYFRYAHHSA